MPTGRKATIHSLAGLNKYEGCSCSVNAKGRHTAIGSLIRVTTINVVNSTIISEVASMIRSRATPITI